MTSTVIFDERSPSAIAVATSAMLRTWPVRFDAMKLTLSVRSFHVRDARHLGLSAQLSFGADFARHAGDFASEALS